MGSFVGLYTGLSAIQAAQAGMDVTSHNIANANTSGYTRQRVETVARPSYQSAYGPVGTGVRVEDIARLRDSFLDARMRAATGDFQSASIRADFLASMERLAGEPDLGLSSQIGKLWSAAEEWSNDPNDAASRRQVLTEMAAIAEGFVATADAWAQLGEDTRARQDVVVDQINQTLAAVAELNGRLANADRTRVGSDLLDQRDRLIDQLAGLVGAGARIETDGTISVTLGQGADAIDLARHPLDPAVIALDADGVATITLTDADGATSTSQPPVSGQLGGLQRVLNEDLPQWQRQLDGLAATFATAINDRNQAGVLTDGVSGGALYGFNAIDADTPGATAASLRLLTSEPNALAAAESGAPPSPHDGSNARLFADLRTERLPRPDLFAGSPPPGPDATIESQLADLITGLAGSVRSSKATADAANGVASGARLARAAEHGVSIDEEMVSLVRYQRALEAAARVMTTVDQALDTLVNRVGIVGR